ncbi:metallophosphoesterase family protein [Catellatospora sichuanensis]|uniref:metallophosphoesterase family protein n=1 Tax=Catellatospora sichuanensis TaxID=1969805 RepID=UPI001182663B|nr:metallophosphoesterase [Catellatospora sichuanensis]
MRVTGTELTTVTGLSYRQARSGGGTESARLPVQRLAVERAPEGCDAVLVAGDLQGVAPSPYGGAAVLLGVALADHLAGWAQQGLMPPPERLAVVLAGDLYSAPTADVRGASGDVADVWLAFAAAGCRFVTGVLGNHDALRPSDLAGLDPAPALLDGDAVACGGVRFAGVGGIVGDPARPGRRAEADQLTRLDRALATAPDLLVLHEGPTGRRPDQRGNAALGERIRRAAPPLTVCGHVHWPEPLSTLGDGHVVNVDSRAVLLTPDR